MNETIIQSFLEDFYAYISFEEGQEPNLESFRGLFMDEAVLIEYSDTSKGILSVDNIEHHVYEFEKVFHDYPIIKSKGFNEKEISHTISISGPMAFVESKYLKKYYNGSDYIETVGTNSIHLIWKENDLKIASIGWYEEG